MAEPRGYRLNNPLNIRRTATAWVGLAVRRADAEFCAFESPEYGIRAAAKILQTYQEKHGIGTLRRRCVAMGATGGQQRYLCLHHGRIDMGRH